MSHSPFEPPPQQPAPLPSGGPKPAVWNWYVLYCVLMAVLYLAVTIVGATMFVFATDWADSVDEDAIVLRVQGALFAATGFALFWLYAVAPLLPKKKVAWIMGFITIGVGMTSACCLPATIPLLIFWLKDDLKAYLNVR